MKWTAIVQLLPGRRWGVHSWPRLNWDASPWVTVNEIGPIPSIVDPVLVRVTTCFLGRPTTTLPKLTLVGEAINVPDWSTVRLRGVVFVREPDVPEIVSGAIPVVAVAEAVKVSTLAVVAGFGLKSAVTPLGSPKAERVTLPEKPFCGVIVIVLVPLLPWFMVTLFGLAESVKFGAAPDVTKSTPSTAKSLHVAAQAVRL
jgi:hypothetical protein